MNCSKCGKPMAAGASKCGACGAEASSSYSYDLAPEAEETKGKKEEPAAFMLPPGVSAPAGGPPAPGERPARPPRGERQRGAGGATLQGSGFSMKTMGIAAAVLVIFVLLVMKMCGGPSATITMQNKKSSGTATVSNLQPKVVSFQLVGEASYTFKVEAVDGDFLVGVPSRGSRDKINPEVIKGWGLTAVKKGETQELSGKVGTGSYSFIIATESKRIVRAKFEYQVK